MGKNTRNWFKVTGKWVKLLEVGLNPFKLIENRENTTRKIDKIGLNQINVMEKRKFSNTWSRSLILSVEMVLAKHCCSLQDTFSSWGIHILDSGLCSTGSLACKLHSKSASQWPRRHQAHSWLLPVGDDVDQHLYFQTII